jgi:4-amino-4-deoxy-L-arabinose transferase-like glycosyltransferase
LGTIFSEKRLPASGIMPLETAMTATAAERRVPTLFDAEPGPILLALLLAAILAVRIVGLAVSNAELYFDEAQYWSWAQQFDFGYFTKPPLIAWIIGAATSVCGDTPFCIRLPSPLMHCATAFLLYLVGLRLFDRRVAFWSALVYALMPGTALSSGLMSTDVPLLLAWSLGLLAVVRHAGRPSLADGALAGLAVGIGLNAKYAMAYFVLCYAVYAVWSPRGRATLRHPGTWLGLALALALIAPNLVWNASHGFATVAHVGENAGWGGRFPNIGGLFEFLGTQAGIIGPVPFVAFFVALAGRAALDTEPKRLLASWSLPVFALIALQALISKANGNWAAAGFPAAVVLATAAMVRLEWRRGMIATLVLSVLCLFGFAFYGSLAGVVTTGPIGREMNKLTGWSEFAGHVEAASGRTGVRTVVFGGRGLTASMLYALRDSGLDMKTYLAPGAPPDDHFQMTRPWSPGDPGPVLFVFPGNATPPASMARRIKRVETFPTRVDVAKRVGWVASIYRLE